MEMVELDHPTVNPTGRKPHPGTQSCQSPFSTHCGTLLRITGISEGNTLYERHRYKNKQKTKTENRNKQPERNRYNAERRFYKTP